MVSVRPSAWQGECEMAAAWYDDKDKRLRYETLRPGYEMPKGPVQFALIHGRYTEKWIQGHLFCVLDEVKRDLPKPPYLEVKTAATEDKKAGERLLKGLVDRRGPDVLQLTVQDMYHNDSILGKARIKRYHREIAAECQQSQGQDATSRATGPSASRLTPVTGPASAPRTSSDTTTRRVKPRVDSPPTIAGASTLSPSAAALKRGSEEIVTKSDSDDDMNHDASLLGKAHIERYTGEVAEKRQQSHGHGASSRSAAHSVTWPRSQSFSPGHAHVKPAAAPCTSSDTTTRRVKPRVDSAPTIAGAIRPGTTAPALKRGSEEIVTILDSDDDVNHDASILGRVHTERCTREIAVGRQQSHGHGASSRSADHSVTRAGSQSSSRGHAHVEPAAAPCTSSDTIPERKKPRVDSAPTSAGASTSSPGAAALQRRSYEIVTLFDSECVEDI